MEWYYEKAGKQNGPIDAADLVRLFEAGDLSLTSLVWREGLADWMPLEKADILKNEQGEELAVCAHSGEVRPKSEMVPYGERWVLPDHREDFVQHLMEGSEVEGSEDVGDYDPSASRYFNQAWQLYTADFWPMVGVTAVILIIYSVASQAPFGGLLATPLFAGLSYYMLLKVRGKSARMEDSFSGFSRNFWQLILMALVSGLLMLVVMVPGILVILGGTVAIDKFSEVAGVSIVVLGVIVLLIPLIYINVAWMFAGLLCVDKKIDFWSSMSLSMKAVNKHWFACMLFGMLLGLVSLMGTVMICVGLFFTLPWSMLALACFYEDVFGRQRLRELESGDQ